ncbi:hypothetical protein NEHOM01_1748 [Nematocida homosporus]|uniref:uncharacterized protein n=1 Tax=Nematocida homosporus TaxID=1912981 RepID=UPI002220006B|nr:uncharacterized protein NEHOM01_1748 [Nematocida homosporus]KAI5186853.1 hypothetical protein NEHOM01_1748 [Nematocida homosporus]
MNGESVNRKHLPSLKRGEKFHELFKSIPKNEALEYSNTCLLNENSKYYQGRIYISTEHICFFTKSFFGKASIIIDFKNVIAIEVTTKILLQHCLNIITYDKTYSFRAVSFKEDAYPVALQLWQKVMELPAGTKSIFQADFPRPAEKVEEKHMSEEEQIYNVPIRQLLKEITNQRKTLEFYQTLTNQKIEIKTYINRRTIQFDNEFIDEIYKVGNNALSIDYHSKGTLCWIYLTPIHKDQTNVRIIEKYNYTTQHYFAYLHEIITETKQKPDIVDLVFLISMAVLLVIKLIWYSCF